MTAVIRFAEAVLQASVSYVLACWDSAGIRQRTRDHDKQLHEVVVDRWRAGRLEDEHVLISDRRVDLHARLERQKLGDMARRQSDSESVGFGRMRGK